MPGLSGQPVGQPPVKRQPGWKPMPRPPVLSDVTVIPDVPGYGQRSMWKYPPVGEAQRRDPHVGDPSPNIAPGKSQADASPSIPIQGVPSTGRFSAGDGAVYEGTPPASVYIKRIGKMMTRTLSANIFSSIIDARWRLGGIGYPPDFGLGPGYHGDAETAYPNNPQVYLRNPGIIPLTNVPATWRYAPGSGIQPVGPSIADVGNTFQPGALSS